MHLTTSLRTSSLVFILLAATAGSAGADMHWGPLDADDCSAIGYRQHNAILWDIPWGMSWADACWSTPHQDTGRPPDRCEQVLLWQFGEWDLEDSWCPYWSYDAANSLNGCIPNLPQGTHREAHILWDIPAGMDWEDVCMTTPAILDGHYFSGPEYCTSCGFFNICGVFLVPDPTCPACGDTICQYWRGETCGGCEIDCGACDVCGDNACTGHETPMSCAEDCGDCGNGYCGAGESCSNCPVDCGTCLTTCNGTPAGPYAGNFWIGVRHPYTRCGIWNGTYFANSMTEAQSCAAAAFPGKQILPNAIMNQYLYSTPFDIPCVEVLVPAFSESDAATCAESLGVPFAGACP